MRTKKLLKSFPKIPRKRFIKLISKARGLKLSNREVYCLFTFADKFQEKFNAMVNGFGNLAKSIMHTKEATDNFAIAAGGYVSQAPYIIGTPKENNL